MIDAHQRAEAYRMAAFGLGWENVCVRLDIRDAAMQDEIRDIVLRKETSKPRYTAQFEIGRKRGHTIRNRQTCSTANRRAPITLPTISILGEDQ